MAAGTAAAGCLHVVSSNAGTAFADLGGGPWWLQAYLPPDREAIVPVLEEAVARGARAVVLTADTPFPGTKYAVDDADWTGIDLSWWRTNFAEPESPDPWKGALTPDDVAWLRDRAGVPVVVKGVLRGDDAVRCLDAGAAAIYVSNHGGRQLDRSVQHRPRPGRGRRGRGGPGRGVRRRRHPQRPGCDGGPGARRPRGPRRAARAPRPGGGRCPRRRAGSSPSCPTELARGPRPGRLRARPPTRATCWPTEARQAADLRVLRCGPAHATPICVAVDDPILFSPVARVRREARPRGRASGPEAATQRSQRSPSPGGVVARLIFENSTVCLSMNWFV